MNDQNFNEPHGNSGVSNSGANEQPQAPQSHDTAQQGNQQQGLQQQGYQQQGYQQVGSQQGNAQQSQQYASGNGYHQSQQQAYQQGHLQGTFPQAPKTNTLAIVAFVGSFFVSLVGIICGHIALKQIKRTGEGGRGLALAGTIIGYVFTAIYALMIVWMLLMFAFMGVTFFSVFSGLENGTIDEPDFSGTTEEFDGYESPENDSFENEYEEPFGNSSFSSDDNVDRGTYFDSAVIG